MIPVSLSLPPSVSPPAPSSKRNWPEITPDIKTHRTNAAAAAIRRVGEWGTMATFGAARTQACGPWGESGSGAVGDALESGMSPDGSLCSSILPCLGRTEQPLRQAPRLPHLTLPPPVQDNHSDKSTRTIRKRTKNGTRTTQVGRRTNKRHDRRVAISDDENEKKMKGKRSYVFTLAASSLAWALALVPYWGMYCSHTTLSIPKAFEDVLHIGYIFLIITVVIVTAHSSQFKDGKLPDNAGFKLLQTVQVLVLLCLWAGTFIPQHVCRRMSNLVVWTCAAGALSIIVTSWALVFQHKMVITECIKALCQIVVKCAQALCEMDIKCTKVMYDRVQQWLPDPSLPECIKAKFKKMPEGKSDSGVPMERV